jgi:sugar phosphate permease
MDAAPSPSASPSPSSRVALISPGAHAVSDSSALSTASAEDELTPAEQKATLKKVTWRLIPYISFLYMLCFLDRANIGNAHGSLLQDLGITEEEYAGAVAIFFVGYILCEVPSNLLMKKISANIWIARIMILWVRMLFCSFSECT